MSKLEKHSATFTYDPYVNVYYFAPENRTSPPYLKQIRVEAIIDIAQDGTLAGIELLDIPSEHTPPGLKYLGVKCLIEKNKLEQAYKKHVGLVARVLRKVFATYPVNPYKTVARMTAYFESLPDDGKYTILHDDPLDLAIVWGQLQVNVNDPEILQQYKKLKGDSDE